VTARLDCGLARATDHHSSLQGEDGSPEGMKAACALLWEAWRCDDCAAYFVTWTGRIGVRRLAGWQNPVVASLDALGPSLVPRTSMLESVSMGPSLLGASKTFRGRMRVLVGPGDTPAWLVPLGAMRGSATAGTPQWRRLAIIAANPRGAVYGTIVATALIAATAAGGKSPGLILAATVATLLVFWLAHVYADFLDHGLRHASSDWKVLVSVMGQELAILAAPALSILFLLLGALGLLDEGLAVRLALWNGVVQLVGGALTWAADADEHGRRRCLWV
jgi:hypothetical protein